MQRKLWHLAFLVVGVLLAGQSEAFMVTPLNIEDLTKRADKVFVGTCQTVSRSVNAHGIPVIDVTFTVGAVIKGEVGTTITFQQIDPQAPRTPVASATQEKQISENSRSIFAAASIASLPNYTPGEEVLLFLAAPGKLGLTAPIGITQGKLPITTLPSGEKVITNTALRKTALPNSSLPDPGKAMHYDRMLSVLQTLTDASQK